MTSLDRDEIKSRFTLLSGEDADGCAALCAEAAEEIENREREDCGEAPQSLLCAAAGTLAFYRWALAQAGGQPGSFSAGDIKVAGTGDGVSHARRLWRETLAAAAPYLRDTGSFLFERTAP